MKCLKITNTHWLNTVVPQIQDYCKIVNSPAIYPQTLATSLHESIQFGGEASEVWAAFETEEPVAFARFFVMPLPHIGTTCCDCFYSWDKGKKSRELLLDVLMSFTKKNRATYVIFNFYNGKSIYKSVNDIMQDGIINDDVKGMLLK